MAEQKKQEQDTNQLLKVRREKLAELQANGKDPFQITKFNQTHHSLEVKEIYEAHEAELLKDHKEPEVEGLDEEQKKEVLKKDYEERRSIMDANPIHVAVAGRSNFFAIQMSNHAVQNAGGYCKNNTFDNVDGHFFVLLVCSYFYTFS